MLKTMLDILQTLSLSLSAVSFFYNGVIRVQDACFLFFFLTFIELNVLLCFAVIWHFIKLPDTQKIKFSSTENSINHFG